MREVFWDHLSFSSEINKAARFKLIKNFLNHKCFKTAKEEATLFFEDENPFLISQQLSNSPDVIISDGKTPFHGISMDYRELPKLLLLKKL